MGQELYLLIKIFKTNSIYYQGLSVPQPQIFRNPGFKDLWKCPRAWWGWLHMMGLYPLRRSTSASKLHIEESSSTIMTFSSMDSLPCTVAPPVKRENKGFHSHFRHHSNYERSDFITCFLFLIIMVNKNRAKKGIGMIFSLFQHIKVIWNGARIIRRLSSVNNLTY